MKRIAVYPGSFDPITLGHLDIIRRVSLQFDELIVLVATATDKSSLFSADERLDFIRSATSGLEKVRVESFDGLTVEFARQKSAQVIVRGIRAVSDFENEFAMANINRKLAPELETMVAFTSPEYAHIASRLVKEVAKFGGDVSSFVPEHVAQAIRKKMTEKES